MAQFGKYLPGNIAHLAGRHYFFAKAGVPQKSLLAAAVVEAALLVAAGGSITALFLPHEAIPLLDRYLPLSGGEWLLLYIAFFFISASTLAGSLAALSPAAVEPHDWMPIVAACSAAWIAGFVIPGAPGGLGIRETVLVLLLSPRFGGETALIAALLYRGVTLAGDALAAVVGLLMANGRMMRRFRSADRDGRSRTST
jgi:uncharacterized membrane protein YbhN (UPF0104 family)